MLVFAEIRIAWLTLQKKYLDLQEMIINNGITVPGVTVERQKKETKWTLQTVYPYGLNDIVDDEYMVKRSQSC